MVKLSQVVPVKSELDASAARVAKMTEKERKNAMAKLSYFLQNNEGNDDIAKTRGAEREHWLAVLLTDSVEGKKEAEKKLKSKREVRTSNEQT